MFSPSSALPNTPQAPKHPPASAGFGLVELLVSVSIMALVSGIVLTRQSGFNSAVLLQSEAYEVALTIRDVQLSAVSVTGDPTDIDSFRETKGIHFDTSGSLSRLYQPFTDGDDDDYFDPAEATGPPQRLSDRFYIREIRAGGNPREALSIVFDRPNFDARFIDSSGEINVTSVEIEIAPVGVTGDTCGEDYRVVEVTSTGQVTVASCP